MSDRIITSNLREEFISARQISNGQRDTLAEQKKSQERKLHRFSTASVYGPQGGSAGIDVLGIAPEYHIPQLENSSLELPRYRQEIINWCDYYYQTDELIGTAVDIHATLSVADFSVSCRDRKVQQEYEDILDELDYHELLSEIAHEYFRVGNAFPMGSWDENNKTWREFILIPMLNVEMKRSLLSKDPKIYLMMNDNVKQTMNDPDLKDELSEFPEDIQSKLKQGAPVQLDPNRVSHLSTKSIAGTLWGVPPIYRCFKTLVYKDKLFRAQEAIADGHITPIRIISLTTPDGMPVAPEEEESFRSQLIEQQYDPNYIILTSGTAKDSYIGSNGRTIPMNAEQDGIERRVQSGMKINSALLHGEGPTYANAQVYQTTMNYYYLHFRNRLKTWLLKKVFTPIAKARGYYTRTSSDETTNLNIDEKTKRLLLPDIVWNGLGNVDAQQTALIKDLWVGKKVSSDTYMKIVVPNIDPNEEKIKVLSEAAEDAVMSQVAPTLEENLESPVKIENTDSGEDDGESLGDDGDGKAGGPPAKIRPPEANGKSSIRG